MYCSLVILLVLLYFKVRNQSETPVIINSIHRLLILLIAIQPSSRQTCSDLVNSMLMSFIDDSRILELKAEATYIIFLPRLIGMTGRISL